MKKHIVLLLVLWITVLGCRPAVMRLIGNEGAGKDDIDTQIEKAVRQLVSTMRPIYRNHKRYRAIYPIPNANEDGTEIVTNNNRTYKISEENGAYTTEYLFDGPRKDDSGKIRLAFLGIGDVSSEFDDQFTDDRNSVLSEKILAHLFLQDEISNNFMILERLSHGSEFEDWDEQVEVIPEKRTSTWTEVYDGVKNAPEETKTDIEDVKTYGALTIATEIAQRYKAVDVILTGFLAESGEHYELHLRMIEPRHGQVVAVGSTKFRRETIEEGFGTWSGGETWY